MATRKRITAPARKREAANTSAPAYFLSLTVENVRCFGPAQTLDLSDGNGRPAQWTIILGDNGVGKTTLLKSLVAMTPFPIKTTIEGRSTMEELYAPRLSLDASLNTKWNVLRNSTNNPSPEMKASFSTGASLTTNTTSASIEYRLKLPKPMVSTLVMVDMVYPGYLEHFVYFAYGAARRMGATALSTSAQSDANTSLFSDDVPLLNAEEWMLRADYAASKSEKLHTYLRERRDQVREALLRLLPNIKDIRVTEPNKEQPVPAVKFMTPYGWVHLQELSLGYKTLIAWTVDLANRMFDRYPDSPNPLAEPAVCLVDEIDLHLHPTWQRKLIGYLTDLFPNTQFIVTAHSPLVVQAATDANIVVLRREGDHVVIDNSIESLKGWSVDQILTSDLYGVASERPPEYDDVLAERQRLLSKPELTTNDKRRLRTLEAKVEELPIGETPQDIAAFDLVRRFAADLERRGVTTETFADDETEKTEAKQNTKRAPRAKQAAQAKQKSSRKPAKR